MSSPHISPLHHPNQQAIVQPPQAPLGSNGAHNLPVNSPSTISMGPSLGAGQKALLQKRMASNKPSMVSPTDNMMSPCTAKLAGAKKKHFNKGKPLLLQRTFTDIAKASADSDDENTAPKQQQQQQQQ